MYVHVFIITHVIIIHQRLYQINYNYNYILLTLACLGGAEGHCNLMFCVCVYEWTTNNIGISIELPTDVKLYKVQNKRFGCKVMTIFTTHDCRFISFRRLLVAKEYTETQLILFEGYCCQMTA